MKTEYSRKQILHTKTNTTVRISVSIILILTIFSSLAILTGRINQKTVEASSGYIDLSEFDFNESIAYIPHTSFLYYQDELYSPDDFSRESIKTKGHTLAGDGRTDPGNFGTYRIMIKLPDNKETYGISSNSAMYSQRLFINGNEYPAAGEPGKTMETTLPKTLHYTFYFTPDTEEVEIIIQFANFHHADYGGIVPLYFGIQNKIMERDGLVQQQNHILVGCAFTAFLFFAGWFTFFFRERAFLWFTLICLSSGLRMLIMGEKAIMILFPELSWNLSIGIEYIALIVLMLSIPLYINKLFEGALHKAVIWIFGAVCALYAATVLLLPPMIYTSFVLWFQICSAVMGIYVSFALIYNVVRKKDNRHAEHILVLTGILIYIALSIVNIWIFRTVWQSLANGLSNIRITILIFVNMIALFLRFFRIQGDLDMARRSEREMHDTNLLLEKMSRLKSDFMANISHEMRTPLTVMSSYAALTSMEIQRGAVNTKTFNNLDTIKHEAVRLANLVEQLKAASLEKERQLMLVDIQPVSLLRQAADLCGPICQQNRNVLLISEETKDVSLCVNPESVFQILVNLIINANRHTKKGTIRLDVQSELETDFAEVSVSDDGEGIDPELKSLLFQRGVSGDGSSGLGLAICKEIVEEHGGIIWVESEKDKGTLVCFTLPKSKGEQKHEKRIHTDR